MTKAALNFSKAAGLFAVSLLRYGVAPGVSESNRIARAALPRNYAAQLHLG
jgi:hypothetical protein